MVEAGLGGLCRFCFVARPLLLFLPGRKPSSSSMTLVLRNDDTMCLRCSVSVFFLALYPFEAHRQSFPSYEEGLTRCMATSLGVHQV